MAAETSRLPSSERASSTSDFKMPCAPSLTGVSLDTDQIITLARFLVAQDFIGQLLLERARRLVLLH